MNILQSLEAAYATFKATRSKHFYVFIADEDTFKINQYTENASVEAIAPVLNECMRQSVEDGTMTEYASGDEKQHLENRKAFIDEQKRQGKL